MKNPFFLLILIWCLGGCLAAQVGINNPNPSQALDVGGKIKVSNDEIAPVAGTIRYNRTAKTFEGYDGTEWTVFNLDADGGGGNGSNSPAVGDVVRSVINISVLSPSGSRNFDWYSSLVYEDDSFEIVPAGATLVVTSIVYSPEEVNSSFSFRVFARDGAVGLRHGALYIHGNQNTQANQISDPTGQILRVPSGSNMGLIWDGFRGSIRVTGYLE